MHPTTRRTVVGCLGVACLAGAAGCAEYDAGSAASAPVADDGSPVAAVADVPVGGAVIRAEHAAVVTQPTEGEFLAFSHACTHQGCPVTAVEGDEIVCGCHGSRFSLDGSVAKGPATKPLTALPLRIRGQDLLLG